MVRILGFYCRGLGSIPGPGTEIPQAVQGGQKKKKSTSSIKENTNFARTNSGYKIIYLRIFFNISPDHEK